MKTKELIKKTLSKKDLQNMKLLTTVNVAVKLLHIFKTHIGFEDSITRNGLFKKVFGRDESVSLADELRWDYIKRAMHLCRQRTKCFIGSKCVESVWHYFVVKDETDAQYYIDNLNRNIKAMRNAQRKAMDSVKKGYYKMDWLADAKDKTRLIV